MFDFGRNIDRVGTIWTSSKIKDLEMYEIAGEFLSLKLHQTA